MSNSIKSIRLRFGVASAILLAGILYGCAGSSGTSSNFNGLPNGKASLAQIARGRYLAISAGCDCHSRGSNNPADPGWFTGYHAGDQTGSFQLGPTTVVNAPNLTPDVATGIGGFSDQAIFNAIKFGYDPSSPAGGPQRYLAPIMPWASFRHHSDEDIWAIVAYLKHGLAPVTNNVPSNVGGPADFWASTSSDAVIGPLVSPSYPTANEKFNP